MSGVVLKVDSNNCLMDIGEQWEVGYGPEICKDFRAQGGFFEEWSDYGSFQIRCNVTIQK